MSLTLILLLGIGTTFPFVVPANDESFGRYFENNAYMYLPSKFTFMARLYIRPRTAVTKTRLCSGTLMLRNWVLTVAHCLQDIKPEEITVYIGDNKTKIQETVVEVHPHPEYNNVTYVNDIGLLKLNQHVDEALVPMGVYTHRHRLQMEMMVTLDIRYLHIVALGWVGDKPTLRTIKLVKHKTVHNSSICNPTGSTEEFEKRLCIEALNSKDVMDKGDSGGPIFFLTFQNGTLSYTQMGVLSYVKTFKRFQDRFNSPPSLISSRSVYVTTIILPYFNWIREIIGNNTRRYELHETLKGIKKYSKKDLRKLGRQMIDDNVVHNFLLFPNTQPDVNTMIAGIPPNLNLTDQVQDFRNVLENDGNGRFTSTDSLNEEELVPSRRRLGGTSINFIDRRFYGN